MAKKTPLFKITLTFTEGDVQDILNCASFGNIKPLKVKDLKKDPKLLKALKKEFENTAGNFVFEIVDGSYEACANGWLEGWSGEPEEDE